MADIDKSVRKQVFSHLLDGLDRAISATEDETSKQPSERRAELIVGGGLDLDRDLATLRAKLGAVRHEVAGRLNRITAAGGAWDINWTEKDEAALAEEVRFSINIMLEAINRIYGQDMEEFNGRWRSIERKKGLVSMGGGGLSFNPLDIVSWLRTLTAAQSHHQVSNALQTLVFLQLEQDTVQHLGFLLFDLNHRLSERGIGGEARGPRGGSGENGAGQWNAPERTGGGEKGSKGTNDEALFGTIMNLLENWTPTAVETQEPELYKGSVHNYTQPRPLNQQEVMATILTLQQWVPKVLEDAIGSEGGQLGEHIRDLMIKQAEALGVPPGQATISEEDNEAVDLVDEAFTNSLYQRRIQDAARQVMAQILFPSVKAAILNRNWFADENHPARKFISTTADAVAPEHGEGSEDVIAKAREAVNKLVSGFNEDVSIFEHLTNDLQDYLASKQRRITPEEEAREDAARLAVIRKELADLWKNWKGPDPVLAFVLEVGGEHLMRLEKNGQRASPPWQSSLNTLSSLLGMESSVQKKVAIDGVLRESLMTMLTGSGWTGVRAHARLAEMEDAIHAWYALGQRDFDNKPLDLEELLNQELLVHGPNGEPIAPAEAKKPKKMDLHDIVRRRAKEAQQAEHGLSIGQARETIRIIEKPATAVPQTSPTPIPVARPAGWGGSKPVSPKSPGLAGGQGKPEARTNAAGKENPPAPGMTASSQTNGAGQTGTAFGETGKEDNKAAVEDVVLAKITSLKIGSTSTWINASNDMVVLKLSWISPISQKYLFVNSDGARALAGTPKELAGMAHKGRFFPGVTP